MTESEISFHLKFKHCRVGWVGDMKITLTDNIHSYYHINIFKWSSYGIHKLYAQFTVWTTFRLPGTHL